MACKPYTSTNNYTSHHQATKTPSFPRPPAPPQPPLLAQASPQYSFWPPVNRPAPRAKTPRCYDAVTGPKKSAAPMFSASITVAGPSKKPTAPAAELEVEWTETDSVYSVSPPPSSVPLPTSLLVTVAAGRKAPTACAVEVTGAGGGVDVGATDELRRLLRL